MYIENDIEEHCYQSFMKSLVEQSFKIMRLNIALVKDKLSLPKVDDEHHAPFELSMLQTDYNTDYTLILQPTAFGIQHHYHSFIST